MDHPRYTKRTVQWGHWGITLMDIQKDRTKNYGEIVSTIHFPVVNGSGPFVEKHRYQIDIDNWINDGILPKGA